MHCAKFGWNWPSGSEGEDENVKCLWQQQQQRRTMDKFWSEMPTWAFGSGELKMKDYYFKGVGGGLIMSIIVELFIELQ